METTSFVSLYLSVYLNICLPTTCMFYLYALIHVGLFACLIYYIHSCHFFFFLPRHREEVSVPNHESEGLSPSWGSRLAAHPLFILS